MVHVSVCEIPLVCFDLTDPYCISKSDIMMLMVHFFQDYFRYWSVFVSLTFFLRFEKNGLGSLISVMLNLYVTLDGINIVMILILPGEHECPSI